MEGVEPLGNDLDLLRTFYELGVRAIGLTHARTNAAGHGGIFAASGSSPEGLTPFGRGLVRECERLGVLIDLAHINPAGFKEIVDLTTKPLIVSHTNARKFYDVERNISDEQIKMIGERGGVIGVNSVLVSPDQETSTLDCYVDHVQRIVDLASARLSRGETKNRPQPLPAGEQAVAHRLVNRRRPHIFLRQISIQRAIDFLLPRFKIRFQIHCATRWHCRSRFGRCARDFLRSLQSRLVSCALREKRR